MFPPIPFSFSLNPIATILRSLFFYAPRTSSITQTRGAGTPTETRATVATVMGYGPTAVLADGQTLLTVAADELRHEGARRVSEGVWSTVDADGAPIPAATLKGALVEAAATQYLGVTGTPATQTTASLGTGTYTLWVEGTGSALASAGTATISGEAAATEGSHNTFTVSGAGTVTVTVTGSLTFFQLENSPYPTQRIDNAGAVGTSATRNKDVLDDQVASNLTAAAGSVAFQWTPSHAPSGTIALAGSYVDADNYTALLHDATNLIFRKRIAATNYDATIAHAFVSGTTYDISLRWGASGSQIALDGVLGTANTTGIEGVQYGKLPGTAGAYFSAPDSAANSITGDIDIRVKVALDDWTPATIQALVCKDDGVGGNRSFEFYVTTAAKLEFAYTNNGTSFAGRIATSSAANTFVNGSTNWVRVTYNSTTGKVNFYTSSDGVSYTPLGTEQTIAAGSIFDSTSPIEIGSYALGTVGVMSGKGYRAQIYNGIDGTLAVDFNPTDYTHGTTWTSSITGEVYTINGNAAVWPAVKLGTRWQWGADGNGGQQAGAAFKEMYLTPRTMSDAELQAIIV